MDKDRNKAFENPQSLITWGDTPKSSLYNRRKNHNENNSNQTASYEIVRERIVLSSFEILVKPTPFSKSKQNYSISQNSSYLNPKILVDQGIFYEVTSPSLPSNSPLITNTNRKRHRSVTKNSKPGILKKEGSSRFSASRKNNRSCSKSRVIILETDWDSMLEKEHKSERSTVI